MRYFYVVFQIFHEVKKRKYKVNKIETEIKGLAYELVHEEANETGKSYSKYISLGLDRACEILKVNRKEFIKMFL